MHTQRVDVVAGDSAFRIDGVGESSLAASRAGAGSVESGGDPS
jgi:hypothetical protein